MNSPYTILGVSEEAGDEAIKKAYLAKVKQHSPDLDPEGFQLIRAAFEAIRDEKSRLHHRLFHIPEPDLDGLAALVFCKVRPTRPSAEKITAYLADCIKDYKIITE